MIAAKATASRAAQTPAARAKPAEPAASQFANAAWARVAFGIQTKVAVNEPGDAFEQEADSVADQVMRMTDPTLIGASPPAIQRKCACGGSGEDTCTCHDHDNEEKSNGGLIQRRAVAAESSDDISSGAAALAADTAHAGGDPLPQPVRAYFEPRFGRDFGDVRVHADDAAAAAARGIQARAYTLGRDVVFGAGEYTPGTESGNRLLAHELTHVVQQAGGATPAIARKISSAASAIQRDVAKVAQIDENAQKLIDSAKNPKRDAGVRATLLVWGILHFYYPTESAALWVNVVSYDEGTKGLATSQVGTGAKSQGKILVGKDFRDHTTEDTLEQRVADVGRALEKIERWRRGKDVPTVCEPNRKLTWADFTGRVTGSYTAFTAYDHTLETVDGEQIIRATFAPARSYVKPAVKDPTNRATSGCGPVIKQCERLLAGKTGVTLPLAADNTCLAGVKPRSEIVATSSAECSSVLGPECDRTRVGESARLLRHEQLHFDIACILARKGTRVLSLKPTESARILQAVKDKAHDLTNDNGAYDSETDHSCNPSAQAAWDKSVAAGMPMATIT